MEKMQSRGIEGLMWKTFIWNVIVNYVEVVFSWPDVMKVEDSLLSFT